ncbi:hypothetical protein NEUTE1DRAFT_101523 [Neurospora tetrasperma FGSC 2508]|uniref:Uncharacterized protein n=1 Tax=Neurospora tetrasperma (strain FGSC 2508 / ATCC MYA-4615 / P0657) TaxID=510951 RepID=F8MP28_NEUT8|nr:uncharacterized protein NEUTE1DRAFT_101523 [Neurospora tetrasperma FGSC 2508]EGO56247.1 hypothetical protein NEUTE1DRAFT_101523 [Neurospora tetrasperma FGSC 2508]
MISITNSATHSNAPHPSLGNALIPAGTSTGNAQLECQRNPLSPALCDPGSNFLQQYNQCQSCIEENSNNPELIKASLAMRFMKCTGYCKLQASTSAPSSATQTEIPTAGQDGDLFTTATTKTSSTSSTSAIQTMISTSANVDYKAETTTSTLPATSKPTTSPAMNNPPTLPTTFTSAPQSTFTPPSSSSSSLSSSTPTSLTTILDTTTQTQISSLTSPTDKSLINSTLLPLQPSSDITSTNNNTKTAPWVWVIVGITITVVFLLSSGSFFFFYKKGRSKRGLTRHEGMKGMVELKETTVGSHGFVDGWSDAASLRTGTTRAGIMRRVMDEAGGPGSNVMELEGSGSGSGSGSGGGRGVGGIGTTKGNGNGNVPPVEMPSCGNGFAELPTEFNRRGPGEEVVVVK